ncbi:squalene/phytoene synthase family protein [Jannaschia sp. Os4]|uniref:squalene/phytoene synthase family protein n=1 Tax=Jannaschia sp. Os4 TaxID=2807617 RepID=UPI001939303E|nr:squalene/phytoene synthase family protein [Jannaschia sp. Os4]
MDDIPGNAPARPGAAPDPWAKAASENFPVASRLLPRGTRARVVAFYRFARAADDAADGGDHSPESRLARLDSLEAGLDGTARNEGSDLRALVDPPALAEARALLPAFRRDVTLTDCADWDDLMAYCASSAVPVGRFLLAVHGEGEDAQAPSDALCAALQVLNHCQDIAADERGLGRCYLPLDLREAAGVARADLTAPAMSPALRAVVRRTLDATDDLLAAAAPLPARIRARGLRAQATATLDLARRLSRRLRHGDPLARRIAPSRLDFARAGLAGLAAAVVGSRR